MKYVQTGAPAQTAAPAKKGGLFDGEDEDEYGAEKVEEVQQEPEPVVEQQQSVEEFVYYDPVQLVKFSFDPITLEAKVEEEYVDSVSSKLDSSVNALRVDII